MLKQPAAVFANVGVHVDVPIGVRLAAHDTEAVEINFGYGPELIIDFADVESLQRLRDAAAEGIRLLRERIEANTDAGRLVGTG